MCVVSEFGDQTRYIRISVKDGEAWLTIERPETDNALNGEVLQELITVFDLIEQEPSIRVVVLEGGGNHAFSSGLDLTEVSGMMRHEAESTARRIADLQQAIATLDRPVIAAIRGTCVGAGLELASFCDFRIAREDARLGLCTISIGLVPGGASLAKLTALVGEGNARALTLTGGVVSAERAFVMGMVTSVVEEDLYESSVDQLARHLAKLPPETVAETLRLHGAVWTNTMDETSRVGEESMGRLIEHEETASRLRALVGCPEPTATVH